MRIANGVCLLTYVYNIGPLIVEVNENLIKIRNEGNESATIVKLELHYYYTVRMPDGSLVRRRGSDTVIDHKELKPGEEFSKNFEVKISGFEIIFYYRGEIIRREVEIS